MNSFITLIDIHVQMVHCSNSFFFIDIKSKANRITYVLYVKHGVKRGTQGQTAHKTAIDRGRKEGRERKEEITFNMRRRHNELKNAFKQNTREFYSNCAGKIIAC